MTFSNPNPVDSGLAGPARRGGRKPLYLYLSILFLALVIIACGSTIWLATDDSATNALATDPQSVTPPAPPAP